MMFLDRIKWDFKKSFAPLEKNCLTLPVMATPSLSDYTSVCLLFHNESLYDDVIRQKKKIHLLRLELIASQKYSVLHA